MIHTDLKLSIAAAALGSDVRQMPRLARERGFAGLLFDACSDMLDIPKLSGSGQREFRQMLGAQDQQLAGLAVDLGSKGLGASADVDQAIARLDRAMEAAAALMSPLVCVELGPLPEPQKIAKPRPSVSAQQAGLLIIPTPAEMQQAQGASPESPPPDPRFVSQVDSALAEIGRRADRYGVMLALRAELSSLAALDRALRQAGCQWMGVDLDPVCILRDEWEIDVVFSQLGQHIRHVRARDAIGGAAHRTKPAIIGRGDVPWPHLLANLDAAGYRGWLTIDPIDLPNRAAATEAGRKHFAGMA